MSDLHPRVAQALKNHEVEHKLHRHKDLPVEVKSPDDFAGALGYEIGRITKTLFIRAQDGSRYAMLVCSMDRRVDFKALTRLLGVRMEVASREDMAEKVGYPHHGVSPLGVDEGIVVVLDEGIRKFDTVLIGGGETGIEIELNPDDLQAASNGTFAAVTK